jgi:hypothetical protein
MPPAAATRGDVERRPPQTEVSTVAWSADRDLAYDQWLRQGRQLGVAGRSAGWWIGDWLRYGAARYGRKYAPAARATGYDTQTLMNMVYVATRFEVSRRRENLSWSHHAELAPLDVEEQEGWLDRAIEQRLTVSGLRRELLAANRRIGSLSHGAPSAAADSSAPAGDPSSGPGVWGDAQVAAARDDSAGLVKCPHCGHCFPPDVTESPAS